MTSNLIPVSVIDPLLGRYWMCAFYWLCKCSSALGSAFLWSTTGQSSLKERITCLKINGMRTACITACLMESAVGLGFFLHQPFPWSVTDALCDPSKESHMPVYLNIPLQFHEAGGGAQVCVGKCWVTGLLWCSLTFLKWILVLPGFHFWLWSSCYPALVPNSLVWFCVRTVVAPLQQ